MCLCVFSLSNNGRPTRRSGGVFDADGQLTTPYKYPVITSSNLKTGNLVFHSYILCVCGVQQQKKNFKPFFFQGFFTSTGKMSDIYLNQNVESGQKGWHYWNKLMELWERIDAMSKKMLLSHVFNRKRFQQLYNLFGKASAFSKTVADMEFIQYIPFLSRMMIIVAKLVTKL